MLLKTVLILLLPLESLHYAIMYYAYGQPNKSEVIWKAKHVLFQFRMCLCTEYHPFRHALWNYLLTYF